MMLYMLLCLVTVVGIVLIPLLVVANIVLVIIAAIVPGAGMDRIQRRRGTGELSGVMGRASE